MQAHVDAVPREYRDDIAIRMPAFSAGYDVVNRVLDRLSQALRASGFWGRLAQICESLRQVCVGVCQRHARESSLTMSAGMCDTYQRIIATRVQHACQSVLRVQWSIRVIC